MSTTVFGYRFKFTKGGCPACGGPLFAQKYEETVLWPIEFTDDRVELCVHRCGHARQFHLVCGAGAAGETGLVCKEQSDEAYLPEGGMDAAYAWMDEVAKEEGVDLAAV